MANIQKKIENLKPGKEYLLTVRAKNGDINVLSKYADSIRFVVPQDSTIPGDITGLELRSNFEKIMFIFNAVDDIDLKTYEYELYSANTTNEAYLVISGSNLANVFTIAVDNSSKQENIIGAIPSGSFTTTTRTYWGRVRAIDTTGNISGWSALTASDPTPLISEEFIDTLTASKITAGVIGAHTITLNGINSILKSTNYSAGSAGWKIAGNGDAEFASAIIRGTIDIGTTPNKFKVLSNGNVEIGDTGSTRLFISSLGAINIGTSLGSGPFQVTSDGAVQIGTSPNLFKISNTGIVEIGNVSGTRLFINSDGAINIGSSLGSGNFKVSALGQVDIGSGTNSFHIASSGTVWSGSSTLTTSSPFVLNTDGSIDIGGDDATSLHITAIGNVFLGIAKANESTAPLKINSDGTLDVGGNDATSLHISAAGEVYSGVAKGNQATAPFLLTPNTGAIRVGDITGSKTIAGLSSVIYLNDSMFVGGNTITGSNAGAGAAWNAAGSKNFQLNAADGFVGRLGTVEFITISDAGVDISVLPLATQGPVYAGQFLRDGTISGNLTTYTSVNAAAWQSAATGKILGVSSASSARYKTDIKPIEYDEFVKKVLSIPVVSFKYKDGAISDEDQRVGLAIPGFIAEDIYDIFPIACDLNSEGLPENWNYKILIPPMLKLIQDMYEKILSLESKLNDFNH